MTRSEGVDGSSSAPPYYTQTWVDQGAGAVVLEIKTTPASQPVPLPVQQQLGSWDSSLISGMATGYSSVTVNDPSGTVVLWSKGLGDDVLVAIAQSLKRRADGGPGWDLNAAASLTLFYEGWSTSVASRSVYWTSDTLIAEMWTVAGYPDIVGLIGQYSDSVSIVDIGGKPGWLTGTSGRVAVLWAETPTVLVRFGLYGTVDDALTIARSMREADAATWEAETVVDTSTDDGCNSMFC